MTQTTTQPRTWSMPEEPGPEVTRLRDRNGDTWYRDRIADDPWTEYEDGPDSAHISFEDLLTELGPLTDITPADAQATPTAPQDSEQGDQPAAYCPYCDQTVLLSSVDPDGQHTACGHTAQFA